MELTIVDKNNYKEAIKIQKEIFPKENGTLNILASLDRDLFMKITGLPYDDDNVKFYLAMVDDKYIGITGIYYYDQDNAWLGWFGILPKNRNKGFGRELLRKTLELAKKMNFKYFRIYTDYIDNHDGVILYEKENFIGEKYTKEKLPYDCRIYSKSLTNDEVSLWNNKNLDLSYQSDLEKMNEEEINKILKKYEKTL